MPELRGAILVVDDQAPNRMLLEGILVGSGYAVVTAEDGPGALACCASGLPDVVLLDVLMPGWDGFETLARLRALPGGSELPVVFVTALGDADTHARALEAGVDDFLPKPVQRAELLLRVRSLARIGRLAVERRRHLEHIRSQRDALLRLEADRRDLAALLVHDLKNPIAAIAINASLLASMPPPDDADEIAADIAAAAESLGRMVVDLLDIARAEDGALAPRCEPVELAPLIAEIGRAFARRAATSSVSVEHDGGAAGSLWADRDLLRRAVENLVDNAIRHAPARSAVRVSASRAVDVVRITVSDRGAGVPAEHRARVFEKYVQLGEQGGGRRTRGLGLAFVRLCAEAHGGRVWVEDHEGGGARFCIELPARAPGDPPP